MCECLRMHMHVCVCVYACKHVYVCTICQIVKTKEEKEVAGMLCDLWYTSTTNALCNNVYILQVYTVH